MASNRSLNFRPLSLNDASLIVSNQIMCGALYIRLGTKVGWSLATVLSYLELWLQPFLLHRRTILLLCELIIDIPSFSVGPR